MAAVTEGAETAIAPLEDALADGAQLRARKADDAVGSLYTIGHSTRTMRQLVDLLRAHGVEQCSTALRYRARSMPSRSAIGT